MDFSGNEDLFYNWDTYYQDPITSYDGNNVIQPNTQVGMKVKVLHINSLIFSFNLSNIALFII